jgi:hypothetical protein
MTEILATKTSLAGRRMLGTFEAARADALFASPSPEQVRRAVTASLRRLGVRGCAAHVAGEFGDHPDIAVPRMSWALGAVNTVYPARSTPPVPRPRPLAFAS